MNAIWVFSGKARRTWTGRKCLITVLKQYSETPGLRVSHSHVHCVQGFPGLPGDKGDMGAKGEKVRGDACDVQINKVIS